MEGGYKTTEAAIRALLAERGDRRIGPAAKPTGEILRAGVKAPPETYLGADKAQGYVPTAPTKGTRRYTAVPAEALRQSAFTLGGRWHVTGESTTGAGGAILRARVVGKAVYLVLSSAGGRPRDVRVRLDGKLISARDAGSDVHDGRVTVRRQRLYRLVSLKDTAEHVLDLGFARGVTGFAFTFG